MNDAPTRDTSSVLVFSLRALFFASAIGLGAYVSQEADGSVQFAAMVVAGALSILVMMADSLAVGRSDVRTVAAVVFGLLIGFLAVQLFTGILTLAVGDLEEAGAKQVFNALRLALTLIFCYLGPAYLLRTKDDFRFIVPYVEFRRVSRGPTPLVLDTSAVIDGRIVDVAATGVFDAPFLVPRSVIEEVQRIADLSDRARRERGRRALDRLKALQELPGVEVQHIQGGPAVRGDDDVDRRLIEVCKGRAAKLVTTDLNLQKVCAVEGVPVLNPNELAEALRLGFVPGDELEVRIVRKGEGPAQGVGYLPDGTMVVVEGARELKGRTIKAEVTSQIQTGAGRMVFAWTGDETEPGDGAAEAAPASEPGEAGQPAAERESA